MLSIHASIFSSAVVSIGFNSRVLANALETLENTNLKEFESFEVGIFTLNGNFNLRPLVASSVVLTGSVFAAGSDPSVMPSIKRLVRESGRPVPRQVATSITWPGVSFPSINFWPSGKSTTRGLSEIGIGIFEIFGSLFCAFFFSDIRHLP